MVSEIFNVDVDTLFTLLFTNSKFYADFNDARKTFGKNESPILVQKIMTFLFRY